MNMTKEEQAMASFDVYSKRAQKLNSMIRETGSKELEQEFDTLLDNINTLVESVTNKYRQDFFDAGFEVVNESKVNIAPTGTGNTYWNPMFNQQLEDEGHIEN